jgi:hypothetical protein
MFIFSSRSAEIIEPCPLKELQNPLTYFIKFKSYKNLIADAGVLAGCLVIGVRTISLLFNENFDL